MTTAYIERTVERYDEETDTYMEDDLVFSLIIYPADPETGSRADVEIDEVLCDGEEYAHEIDKRDIEAVEIEALESFAECKNTPRHLRHKLMDL